MFPQIKHHQGEHSKRAASTQATSFPTKSRGWRRSSNSIQTSSSEVTHKLCKRSSSFAIMPRRRLPVDWPFWGDVTCGSQTTVMNQPLHKSARLQLESKNSEQQQQQPQQRQRQQIQLGQPYSSNRFTDIACTRASSSSSSSPLSLVISGFVNDAAALAEGSKRSVHLHRHRRAIISNLTCPLLAISILLSILSLSFAAVSFASIPSASASVSVSTSSLAGATAAAEAEAEAAAKADFQQHQQQQQPLAGQPFSIVRSDEDHKRWNSQLEFPVASKQIISKKSSASSLEQVSSADLPAEFRDNDEGGAGTDGGNEAVNEQSKLAKLCQQTSSVLASVLPAPFGGHKRSILCQFFGQIPFSRKQVNSNKVAKQENHSFIEQQQQQQQQHHHHHQQVPHLETAESAVALIQNPFGHHQQPVAVLAAGNRHPIEIVLEQQQRHQNQLLMANSRLANSHRAPANHLQLAMDSMQNADLKGSASVVDYAYQQRVEPPASMGRVANSFAANQQGPKSHLFDPINSKYSKPITATSFRPLSSVQVTSKPMMSTSGWRIFNHTSEMQLTSPSVSSSTAAPPREVVGTTRSIKQTASERQQVPKQELTTTNKAPDSALNKTDAAGHKLEPVWSESLNIGSAQLLVMGKPPGFNHQLSPGRQSNSSSEQQQQKQLQANIAKRSEVLKSTTRPAPTEIARKQNEPEQVRTIEVNAQNNHQPSSSATSGGNSQGRTPHGGIPTSENQATNNNNNNNNSHNNVSSSTQKPSTDLRQVQKREELVIASINNLTRIAFGNQLRDTVKVINKLIDQHSDLFNANGKKAKQAHSSASSDPMLTLESGRHQQVVNSLDSKQTIQSAKAKVHSGKNSGHQTSDGGSSLAGNAAQTGGKSRQKQIPPSLLDKTTGTTGTATTTTNARVVAGQFKPTKKPKKQSMQQQLLQTSPTSARIQQQSATPNKPIGFSSQKIATTAKEVSAIPSGRLNGERKLSQQGDLQRLHGHTVSRALTFGPNSGFMFPGSRTTRPSELEQPAPGVIMDDIHRDKSPWKLSKGLSSTTRAVARSLAEHPSTTRFHGKMAQTKFPWLLPDKSVYHSDLFGGLPTTGIATSDEEVDGRKPPVGNMETLRLWTTKRAPTQLGMGGKQALVLNRLDNAKSKEGFAKMDSLTTLKMALNAQSTTTAEPPTWSSFHKTSGSTQSRWIPTVAVTKATVSSVSKAPATTSTTPAPTTTTAISSSTTVASPTTTTATAKEFSQTTMVAPTSTPNLARESLTQNDLNEARASDSISRYTTHWNEANELLATTHKRLLQQPMPQIAQTGDYFSAETISNWPERYQTMLENSKPATQPSFSETTRRNGEAYDNHASSIATRHRLYPTTSDALAQETRTTRAEVITTLAGVTVLPANHKLSTTSNHQVADTSKPSLIDDFSGVHQQTSNSPAYTLVGPLTPNESEEADGIKVELQANSGDNNQVVEGGSGKFPRISDDMYTLAGPEQQTGSTVGLSGLKPPYLEQHDDEPLEVDQDSIISLYNQSSSLSRPQVSRKLYELLVPSTRSFVGPQSPLNQQRFNLSALKFLAQNLFTSSNRKDQHLSANESLASQGGAQVNKNSTDPQRLLDILGASLPPNYQELLLNDDQVADTNKSASITSGSANKSIFGRASNLLNDLRQLEQKKAAAIMAAIRYQVPSPLVRPWDLTTDGHVMSELAGAKDRQDAGQTIGSLDPEQVRDGYMLSQLSNAIRSALFKQRFIPRSELEARLKQASGFEGSSMNSNLSEFSLDREDSERRSDSNLGSIPIRSLPESLGYSMDDNYNPLYNGSRHDEAPEEYLLAGDRSSNKSLVGLTAKNLLPSARGWIDRLLLLGGGGGSGGDNKNSTNGDYDLIDLSASTKSSQNQKDESESTATRYPKYIRLNDNKTNWNEKRTEESRLQALMQKQRLPSEAVAARLKANLANHNKRKPQVNNGTIDNQDEEVEVRDEEAETKGSDTRHLMASQQKQEAEKKESKFSCLDRQTGFYPDSESACQTFYHCSSTGHLLTFSCPQQTRFDEKSLKCGPWYEVPCDLGRIKQRRLYA